MRRTMIVTGIALMVLGACQPSIPNSAAGVPDTGRGVGFNNDVTAARARDAQLASPVLAPVRVDGVPVATSAGAAGPVTSRAQQPAPAAPQPVRTARVQTTGDPELDRLSAEEDARARAANSGQAVVNASPTNAAPTIVNNPGISSEQDFGRVSSQRSIEGDAARIEANRQQYEVVAPTDLPTRRGAGPNVVAYALQTTHAKGTKQYRRVNIASAAKLKRNCAVFASNDDAQAEFLATGGPQRDRKGLDPDGDGYACGWDPAPFRGL